MAIIFEMIRAELWDHAKIRINDGKTKVWNSGGITPAGIETLGDDVWRGSSTLPKSSRGLHILGTPVGRSSYGRCPGSNGSAEETMAVSGATKINW